MEYDFQKSRVTYPWDHKDSVSAKKVKKKFHACVPLRYIKWTCFDNFFPPGLSYPTVQVYVYFRMFKIFIVGKCKHLFQIFALLNCDTDTAASFLLGNPSPALQPS